MNYASKSYKPEVHIGWQKRLFIRILRDLFPNQLNGLPPEKFPIVGRALLLTNLIFQRLLGVNSSAPFLVHYTSRVLLADGITIEDHPESASVYLCMAVSSGCYISGINGIKIGKGVMFAPGVKIISANHDLSSLNSHLASRPIEIGEYAWLGANCVVLPGVSIGARSVVGAGAVVTNDIPDGEIWVGVPARKIASKPGTVEK